MRLRFFCAIAAVLAFAVSCTPKAGVTESSFSCLSTGEPTKLYTIVNRRGASMQLLDYGARIVSVRVPDRNGKMGDVVVGFGDIGNFEKKDRFIGPVIGRYGNRIDRSSFTLDGVLYALTPNETFGGEPVQCHGGPEGFDRFIWDSEPVSGSGRLGVRFHRLSPDGEQGYPGNLDVSVTYWLTDDNAVRIEYEALTDKSTVVNLSNHTYFNLKGDAGGYVMEHLLQVEADSCIQNNTHFCPDLILPVKGSPFDFREPHRVDYRIDMPDEHLRIMHGMSACWVVRDWDGTLRKVADLYDRGSGRGVETWTTEPALLTFTGRSFDGSYEGKYGPIEKFGGMLLETIHFPDSPNQPRFPSTVLRPGEKYSSVTEYRFYAED